LQPHTTPSRRPGRICVAQRAIVAAAPAAETLQADPELALGAQLFRSPFAPAVTI
jgi:hypothetical protein